jgi:hypothetical protein
MRNGWCNKTPMIGQFFVLSSWRFATVKHRAWAATTRESTCLSYHQCFLFAFPHPTTRGETMSKEKWLRTWAYCLGFSDGFIGLYPGFAGSLDDYSRTHSRVTFGLCPTQAHEALHHYYAGCIEGKRELETWFARRAFGHATDNEINEVL